VKTTHDCVATILFRWPDRDQVALSLEKEDEEDFQLPKLGQGEEGKSHGRSGWRSPHLRASRCWSAAAQRGLLAWVPVEGERRERREVGEASRFALCRMEQTETVRLRQQRSCPTAKRLETIAQAF
jgi:hypothetical protein